LVTAAIQRAFFPIRIAPPGLAAASDCAGWGGMRLGEAAMPRAAAKGLQGLRAANGEVRALCQSGFTL
jgi:hypothetical protein